MDIAKYKAEDGGILEAWLDIHKEKCMYVPDYAEWYTWSGKNWEQDKKNHIKLSIILLIAAMNDEARSKLKAAVSDEDKKMWQHYVGATKRTDARVSSVERMARLFCSVESSQLDGMELLNLQNGTLNLETFILCPHDPQDLLTHCLDYDYDETAHSPHWHKITARFTGDVINFFQEFCGYALTPKTNHEITVWLKGERGGGKSTLILGLQTVLGSKAGVLGLSDIEKDRFALADLPGKTLVVATEQPGEYVRSSHIINAIVSGERIRVNKKFKDAIHIVPTCKILWAMNDYPTVANPGDGLYRRIKVIEVPQLNGTIVDPHLQGKLKHEKSGILNWALEGLRRLQTRGKFCIPQSVEASTQQFAHENDVVAMFVEDFCVTGINLSFQSSALYSNYSSWCFASGYKAKSTVKFARDLKRLGFLKERDTVTGTMVWRGIAIK